MVNKVLNMTAVDVIAETDNGKYEALHPREKISRGIELEISRLSSLGLEWEDVLQGILRNTVADIEVLEDIISSGLNGDSELLFGPPGTGKTTAARDIAEKFPKLDYIVEDCPVQDNPLSLVDKDVFRKMPPCPLCMTKYGAMNDMEDIGEFNPEDIEPEKVPVKKFRFRLGRGITRIDGNEDYTPETLMGTLNISKLDEVDDPMSPEIFVPGLLTQGNNGLVIADEIGKLRGSATTPFLQSLEEGHVTPNYCRLSIPARVVAITTSNTEDLRNIPEPLNDRLENIAFDYCQDHEKNMEIAWKIYRKDTQEAPIEEIGWEIYGEFEGKNTILPKPLMEVFVRLQEEYRNSTIYSTQKEGGSNRCMGKMPRKSARYARIKDKNVVDEEAMRKGIISAYRGRARVRGMEEWKEYNENLEEFIDNNLPGILNEVFESYWCKFYTQRAKDNYSDQDVREMVNTIEEVVERDEEKAYLMTEDEMKKTIKENELLTKFFDYVTEDVGNTPESVEYARNMFSMVMEYAGFHCPESPDLYD